MCIVFNKDLLEVKYIQNNPIELSCLLFRVECDECHEHVAQDTSSNEEIIDPLARWPGHLRFSFSLHEFDRFLPANAPTWLEIHEDSELDFDTTTDGRRAFRRTILHVMSMRVSMGCRYV